MKRPESAKRVVSNADYAATQLKNAEYAGGIVIDITDVAAALPPGDTEALYAEVDRHINAVSALFFVDRRGFNPGYEHVRMIAVMARPTWYLVSTKPNEGHARVHSASAGRAFGKAKGTLDHWHGLWLRDQLSKGLDLMNFSSFDLPSGTA